MKSSNVIANSAYLLYYLVKLYCAHEYLNKSNQNLVHYLSCQAVRRTAYLNFCGSRMLKGLGTMALASKVQALAFIEG